MIKVVNVNKEPCTHYCGRKSSYIASEHGIDFSWFGNPFSTRKGSVDPVKDYSEYLWGKFNDTDYHLYCKLDELFEYDGEVKLGCFCKPKRCHCDIIVDVFTEYVYDRCELDIFE